LSQIARWLRCLNSSLTDQVSVVVRRLASEQSDLNRTAEAVMERPRETGAVSSFSVAVASLHA
jgi:hypothetical protein